AIGTGTDVQPRGVAPALPGHEAHLHRDGAAPADHEGGGGDLELVRATEGEEDVEVSVGHALELELGLGALPDHHLAEIDAGRIHPQGTIDAAAAERERHPGAVPRSESDFPLDLSLALGADADGEFDGFADGDGELRGLDL